MKHYKCTLCLSLKQFSLSQEKTITAKKVWLKGRHDTSKGTGWKIHLPLKKLCLESVKGGREMLGVLYPSSPEQKVHTKELKGKTDLQ